ncbi:hypothetical protein [Proteiniborus sp.]|uniref:hypothetical protein n=1 Tax=Proteiniborus sp. TaxID=2079015 RepID=UPI003321AE24
MGVNLYYKKYIEKLINANPATITIKREIKTDDGYGGSIIEVKEITETVTFYDRKARREVVTDYGTTYVGVSVTKILVKGDSQIIEGDKFIYEGKIYKVLFVNPYKDICKQIELEVIK